ncbi:hypothetical protein HYDPIDRAFT_83277 [Hydnomerulius pinastri MD-312]|nr:hypothetical protein HYDPIDRAFT_83277 [Hydnomerulius pinastri MD-312]
MYKSHKTQRGFDYRYLFAKANPGKPTLLFIHGFPSTSFDWYHQINFFKPKGYGLVVPDLLGLGRTEPKPSNPTDFLQTAVAQDMVDILDAEGVADVISIGHDWGSGITGILSMKYSDRFLGFGFTTVTYAAPMVFPPLEVIFEAHKQVYGRPLLGYWALFGQEAAAGIIEKNIDSFLDLMYPADPETWKTYINLPGEMEEFVKQGQRLGQAPYVTNEHYEHIKKSLLEGGLASPLNWYKSNLQGVNNHIKDSTSALSEEQIKIRKPAFMAVAKFDYVCVRDYAIGEIEKYAAGGLTLVEFDTGHWLLLEQPEEYNNALEQWITSTFPLN